jgi:SAM-dependent methyltransferase
MSGGDARTGVRERVSERVKTRIREDVIVPARWRSRRTKGRLIQQAMREWGQTRSLLLIGAGQGWTDLDIEVERAAAEGVPLVVATDLHRYSQVPWPYLVADGTKLPFADGTFDVVVSNAVIEHVGDEADQRRFVAEHLRVARNVVITTPNRWFPLETHTNAFLRHWSPTWRAGRPEIFSRLLSRREFAALLPAGSRIHGRPWSSTFLAITPERPEVTEQ